jgi:hypothetical protein
MRNWLSRLFNRIALGTRLAVKHTYHVVYTHPESGSGRFGTDAWVESFSNIVPNVGLNAILDIVYGATAKWSAIYAFLVTGPGASNTYAAGDTMSSHAGWTEATPYSDSTRPAATFGSASSQAISNSSSPSSYTINATATIAGCGLATVNTKGGTTGTLISVGNFTGGDRSVASGGTLTVTVTATAASA